MSLYDDVTEDAYNQVGVRDGRDGGISDVVTSGDGRAVVELTVEQAKELIRINEAHLPE